MEVHIMKNNNVNLFLSLGLLTIGIVIGFNHFIELPHFIYGFGLGVGLTLELIGMYFSKHDITKVRVLKRNLFKRLFG